MKKFEDFVFGLNEDVEIPEKVNQRFEETLQGIEPAGKLFSFRWVKAVSAAAVIIVACGAFLASNPALASGLPFIGNIFEKVQDKVIYSGDYGKKKALDKNADEIAIYSVKDRDIRLTASEVYSDGFSIFVTMKMESQKYDFSKVEVTQDGRQAINLATSYGVNSDVGAYDYDLLLDGKNEGKSVFIGMVKFDKEEASLESGNVNILVKNISIFQEGEEYEEFIEGKWKLRVPYETDRENSREINVGKETKKGLRIEKLFVSPYQLVVLSDVPECKPYADMTDAEIIDMLGGSATEKKIQKVRNSVDKEFYEYAVFDQDGERLAYEEIGDKEGELQRVIYSLRGREVSEIHIFVTENENNMMKLHQAKTEEAAEKLSEENFVVNLGE